MCTCKVGSVHCSVAGTALLFVILLCPHSVWAGETISLLGKFKYHEGDQLEWAEPDYDDSNWRIENLTSSGTQLGYPKGGIGWYRFEFEITEALANIRLALDLGNLYGADEVYVNGMLIGKSGSFGKYYTIPALPFRLYEIKNHLIEKGKNILAIRVLQLPGETGGMIGGNPRIGDFYTVGPPIQEIIATAKIIDGMILGSMTALWFLLTLSLFIRQKEYLVFWFFLSGYLFGYGVDSSLLFGSAVKTPLLQWAAWLVQILLPGVYIYFLTVAARLRNRWVSILGFSFYGLLTIISSLFPGESELINYLGVAWYGSIIVVVGYAVWTIARYSLVKESNGDMGAILIGTGVLGISICIDSICPPSWFLDRGIKLMSFGIPIFVLCSIYVLAKRFVTSEKQVRHLARCVLWAQEKERERLARELHDGLGQSLALMKLNLQRQKRLSSDRNIRIGFEEAEVCAQHIIDELRGISMNLHPSKLTDGCLVDVLSVYVRNLGILDEPNVELHISDELHASKDVAPHLFRMFQEALGNALKHADATEICVRINQEKDIICMIVKDNGKGFNMENGSSGLGLKTLNERVALLGGLCRISSTVGKGTSVRLEVPNCLPA